MFSPIKNYLFRPGGAYNCAIARVVIASALWLTITHNSNFSIPAYNWDVWLQGVKGAGWMPKGLVKFTDWYFNGIPPGWTYWLAFEIARISIICMAVGIFIPFAQVIATLTTIYCVSLQTSFGPYWSHAYNVQLLAACAFMFARSSDVWSADAWIRKVRGHATPDRGNIYWWPVIFAELATALFMFGAFYQKFRETGFLWALSDNIRNSLGITWFQYRADMPEIAYWIASSPLIYKTAGIMQLFIQSTTIIACFLLFYPVLRLVLGGVFFFIEILALTHVFRFWHPFWVPLCLLSVDFEHFWRQWRRRSVEAKTRQESSLLSKALTGSFRMLFMRRIENGIDQKTERACPTTANIALICGFGIVFFGYYLANLHWRLGEKHLNYPFSSMAFYSENRAIRPYNQHKYFPIYTGRIDSYETDDIKEPVKLWYRNGELEDNLFRVSTLKELRAIHKSASFKASQGLYLLKSSGEGYNYRPVHAARVEYRSGLMAVTPYPESLDFTDLHMGLRAVHDRHGWRALIAKLRWDQERKEYAIELEYEGFKQAKFEVLARTNVREDPQKTEAKPLPGYWKDNTFYVSNSGNSLFHYTLIRVNDAILGIEEIYYGPDNFQTYQ